MTHTIEALDKVADAIEKLRQPHPQQAQIDAESAKKLRKPPWNACAFCDCVTPNEDAWTVGSLRLCSGCMGQTRVILRRLVRQELGLGG